MLLFGRGLARVSVAHSRAQFGLASVTVFTREHGEARPDRVYVRELRIRGTGAHQSTRGNGVADGGAAGRFPHGRGIAGYGAGAGRGTGIQGSRWGMIFSYRLAGRNLAGAGTQL